PAGWAAQASLFWRGLALPCLARLVRLAQPHVEIQATRGAASARLQIESRGLCGNQIAELPAAVKPGVEGRAQFADVLSKRPKLNPVIFLGKVVEHSGDEIHRHLLAVDGGLAGGLGCSLVDFLDLGSRSSQFFRRRRFWRLLQGGGAEDLGIDEFVASRDERRRRLLLAKAVHHQALLADARR